MTYNKIMFISSLAVHMTHGHWGTLRRAVQTQRGHVKAQAFHTGFGLSDPPYHPSLRCNTQLMSSCSIKSLQTAWVNSLKCYRVLWMTEAKIMFAVVGRIWFGDRDCVWEIFCYADLYLPRCGLWACFYDNHHLIAAVCRKAAKYGWKLAANCFMHVL